MKNFIKNHKSFLIMSAVLLFEIIFLIVLLCIKRNSDFAEVWTRTFGRGYTNGFGKFNENLPFSLTEVSVMIVVASCIVYLAYGFCLLGNKKYWGFVNSLMMITLIAVGSVSMYNASVGMAYNRHPLTIGKYEGEIKKEDFKDIATYFVEDYNKIAVKYGVNEEGEIVFPYNRSTIVELLRDEYKRLDGDKYFSNYTPKAKALGTSGLFTSVGIVGMYYGVLGEANYNTYMTNAEFPFNVAHEMAHGKGVMREDDAQIVATYICLTSESDVLRYSCYYSTIESILNILHLSDNKDDYKEVKALISDDVWKNINYIYNHWKGKMFLYDLGNKVNDWYLKTFGQKEGTKSYDDTEPDVDDKGDVISLSHYQSIYFNAYYNQVSQEQ